MIIIGSVIVSSCILVCCFVLLGVEMNSAIENVIRTDTICKDALMLRNGFVCQEMYSEAFTFVS